MGDDPRSDPTWAEHNDSDQIIYDDDCVGHDHNTQCLTLHGVQNVGSISEGSVLLGMSGEPVKVESKGPTVHSKMIKVTATLSMGRGQMGRRTTFFVPHNQHLQLAAAASCRPNLGKVSGAVSMVKRKVTWWTRCTQDDIHDEVASLPYEAALDAIVHIVRQNLSNLRDDFGQLSMSAILMELQTNETIRPHLIKAFEYWCQTNDIENDDVLVADPLDMPEWLTELEQQLNSRVSIYEDMFQSTSQGPHSDSDDEGGLEDDEELDLGRCPNFMEFLNLEAACEAVDSQATDLTFHPELSFSPPGSQIDHPPSSQPQAPSSQPNLPSSQPNPPSSQPHPPSSQQDQSAESQNSAATFRSAQRESFETLFGGLRNTLRPCKHNCKGMRQMSKLFPTAEQAELVYDILNSSLYSLIDPYQVRPGDIFRMTALQLTESCFPHLLKLVIGQDPMRTNGTGLALPKWAPDPYFMGLWLGDGRKDDSTIASSDEETKFWLEDYVDRLNQDWPGPPFKKLRLREDQIFSEEHAEANGYKLAFNYAIANENSGVSKRWNPVRTALERFGLLHDKSGGVPDIYKQATDVDKLKVIAGLMDSDGSLKGACYTLEQVGDDHSKIVYDVAELCTNLGIRHGTS